MATKHVAIASATVLPLPDPDEAGLCAAIRALDADVRVLPWDDDAVDWAWADVVVIRSTWNYVARRDDFVAWAERVARTTRLHNPASIIRENTDKIYLSRLADQGIPVVPTLWLEQGCDAGDAIAQTRARDWADVVIKPRISAGSFQTQRFMLGDGGSAAAARAFLTEQLSQRAMMVQPYQARVDDTGERAIVVIDGEPLFATRKSPRFASGPLEVSAALDIEPDELALARRILSGFEPLLYARVDLVRGEGGAPRLMELELTEPYLMLDRHPPALDRLARAIVAIAA
jgi:glutathione synthase/RimK-type ligase-like ATP-grasp enzyme